MKSVNMIISETINEYLTRNATQARKTLDSKARKDLQKIAKNEWLFHITSLDNAVNILKYGFKGYNNLNFDLPLHGNEYNGSIAFALPLDRSNDLDNGMLFMLNTRGDSNDALVVFQANGFYARHHPKARNYSRDKFNEVLFDTNSVHNCFVITRSNSKEIEQGYPQLAFHDPIYKILLRNGRVINIKDDSKMSNNKIFKWVTDNYSQYKKSLKQDYDTDTFRRKTNAKEGYYLLH